MSKSVLVRSFYKPGRGGHAPDDIRDVFLNAIEAYAAWEDGEPEPQVEVRGRPMRLSEVCSLLWNCRDTMPGIDRDHLEGMLCWPQPSCGSYARAARALKDAVGRALARDVARGRLALSITAPLIAEA